jgi:hypothetical protein
MRLLDEASELCLKRQYVKSRSMRRRECRQFEQRTDRIGFE